MKKRSIEHHLDGLIALLLFGVFAVCVLAVLLTGASAYRRLTVRDGEAYNRRTCLQYVATRVRQADWSGGVLLDEFGDLPALVLSAPEEAPYVTRIYCCDGAIMELYADAQAELGPADGEQIMEVGDMEMSLDDGGRRLTVTITDTTGASSTLRLSLRSGEGAAA